MSEAEILFEQTGKLGLITLNRPKALNALTLSMVRDMRAQLQRWAEDDGIAAVMVQGAGEKGFCAGGDIRALHDSGRDGTDYFLQFFADEYRCDAAVAHFPKPYIALVDGVSMGGGVGVSAHGSHRIVTDRTVFAMPETGIGLIPDVGGSYFLPRMPGRFGRYMALTGARLKAPECLYCGYGTHFLPTEKIGDLAEKLGGLDFGTDAHAAVDAFLADYAGAASEAQIDQETINTLFDGDSLEVLIETLEQAGDDWARKQAQILRGKSPTSLKLTFKQIEEGAALGIDQCLQMEYRIVSRIREGHDFYEGVRAVIIDKDNAPAWEPARLEDVPDTEIERYFASLGEKELDLNARS